MKINSRVLVHVFILLMLLQSSIGLAYGSSCSKQKYKSQIRQTLVGQQIEITPLANKIRMGFGSFSLGDFHYVKTLDRIFFQDSPITVEIKKIDFDNETILAKLFHPKYRFGEITFFFDKEQYEKINANKLKEVFNSSLSDSSLNQVIVNNKTGRYHLPSCNHLPPADLSDTVSREQADQSGNKPCGFCFKHFIYLPDYRLEQSMARKMSANQRYYSPISTSDTDQRALSIAGKKVLDSWPIKLLGYDYKFTLIDNLDVNAYALPGGQIFITTGMYKSLEDPLELEAILAHEIAHIERRHSLKSFIAQRKVIQAQAGIAAMGRAFSVVAASRGHYGTANIALATSITMMTFIEVANGRYSKEHEREADLFANLYFEKNGLEKKSLINVFKKLQFMNLCHFADPDPDSHTHPQLRDRIESIENTTFKMLRGNILNCQKKNFGSLYIDLLLLSEYDNKMTLFLYISDYDFIADKIEVPPYFLVKTKTKNVRFKYSKKDTVFTKFGAILTFNFNNEKNIEIGDFSTTDLIFMENKRGINLEIARYRFLASQK